MLVRLSTVPLVVRQVRAQHELRSHLPELQRLRDRHKHDRERLQLELQEYYRRHGINPLAAFVPVLVQIPIFISLYVLMRQDVSSGLFDGAGFLIIPHLTQRPHGTVLAILVVAYACSQIATGLVTARRAGAGHPGLMIALPHPHPALIHTGDAPAMPLETEPSRFDRFAEAASEYVSRGVFFAGCVLLVVVWAPSYVVLGNFDTWQLLINTATTIVTFLLVALLQNTARRSDRAIHHKLDALADGLADLMEHEVDGDPADLRHDIAELKDAVGLERPTARRPRGGVSSTDRRPAAG